ncbi:hypothetical protein GGI10_000400 [Coemansia sp. RSA 2530]|nr:hypothetical protein GGI10_000400 [Coemansia sp. RSA 2530]
MADDKHEAVAGDDVGSTPTFFKEHKAFLKMLGAVAESASGTETWAQTSLPADEERAVREMCAMLELYQEQPTCLDPYLERIVSRLMAVIEEYVQAYHDSHTPEQKDRVSAARMNGVFELVYMLCKVRGYKVVLRFFPHSVANVEPVLTTLWRHTADLGGSSWTARYIMLIWLSLLAMVPFDLESIDSGIANLPQLSSSASTSVQASPESGTKALVDMWVELGKFYLHRPGCDMEGAAVMLARLLSRKDTSTTLQPAFIAWATHEISDAASGHVGSNTSSSKKGLAIGSVLRINGALRVLCHLFLAMDSADTLRGQIGPLLDGLQSDAFEQHSVTRKLATKAAQRLALLALPPLFAEYREPLLHHLCTVTIYHWDLKTRELAVEALRELAPLAPEYMATRLLPEMLVLSVAETVPSRFTEDFGASLTLAALASYIGCLSRAGWDIGGSQTRDRYFDYFMQALTMCSKPQSITVDFTVFVDTYGITPDQHASGLHDRTVDNRGDVGSWVRQQCLCSLQHLFTVDSRVLTCVCSDSDLALRLLGRILHAATEKIDRLRASAGLLLESFLYGQRGMHAHGTDKPDADTVVERCIEELRAFIPRGQLEDSRGADSKGISWADSESAYGQLVYALSVSEESLRKLLFEGFVVAGSAEPMGKFAVNAVAAYAGTLPAADRGLGPGWTVDGIIAELTRLLLTDKQTSRLINPALIVSDQLIEQGALLAASPKVWIPLHRAVQRVAFRLRAPQRLMLCVKLYGSLALVSSEVARLAGDSLLAHIGHPIPKIRQVAADQLYTMLCINGVVADIDEECETSLGEIERLLSETEWMQDTDSVKASRGRLAELVRQVLRDKSVPR